LPSATLKMFLVYGDPKRLRTVELSNWTGKAVAGPRSEFDKVMERDAKGLFSILVEGLVTSKRVEGFPVR